MKKIVTIVIVIITVIAIFFIKNNYKSFKFGNNISNKSAEQIAKYILDINSYNLTANITVQSNKNTNSYIIKEKYVKDSNMSTQEVVEPESIRGVSFVYDGTNLKVENTKLNLSKIYENYKYIGESTITLIDFINDYSESNESTMLETNEEIVLETKLKNGSKYVSYKKLCVNKSTGLPSKLEIQDITQKTIIYILYNEIEINNLQKEDILAFKLKEVTNDI